MHNEHDVIHLDDGAYRLAGLAPETRRRLEDYREAGRQLEWLEQRMAMLHAARGHYLQALRGELPERRFFWLSLGRLDAAQWSTPRRLSWQSDRVQPGDVLMVYVGGQGAPGMVEVTAEGYRWLARAPRLAGAIGARELRDRFGLSHPTRRLTRLDAARAEVLFRDMQRRW